MKIVGLTGGIGSGKTTVAKLFAELGVPIYIADTEAKKLTNTSKTIRRKLIVLLGDKAYENETLNSKYVAAAIFNDSDLLKKVNAIIHPKVAAHFKRWVSKQTGPYCIKEAAILFENGSYKKCDLTILVTAPKDERINRVLKRGSITREEVEARMANQWTDSKKIKLADIVIRNTNMEATREQVKTIHSTLLK
ncbi:dephospho-CoA kinase [Ulvibacter sp. MAR_2010_11]|uniref:dephospho-CoA kinase n=1 Tax=Ulvibacter sp. MAR_2010_11 TaxID=1250229 RepID=UPI000C2BCAA9|nr:dephospho-CoA kinase [Ulvibacter sp. MAR_2010_11]PKA84621.1 dephospho-CoA kinase [Ulvibacter sp. MAR_2010_11]